MANDYYDDGFEEVEGIATADILNALFTEFGYNEERYGRSRSFTSHQADEVLQEEGLVDDNQYGMFFTWWFSVGKRYIEQVPGRGISKYKFRREP